MRGKERERKGEWEGGRERKEEGKREREGQTFIMWTVIFTALKI